MSVPENELDVYIDSVTVNETKCEMINCTDSIDKNIEMVSETTWYKSITLDVNHKCFDVNFKLDTGAEVNILPLYILNMFKVKSKLSETNLSLTTYGNFKLKPDVYLIINCSTNKLKSVPLPFYVVNVKSKPILGLKGCKELKFIERIDAIECSVISKNELIKQYKDVFTGIGEFPSEPYYITLKDNSVPVIQPPIRVPRALQPMLKSTLNNLEKEGIVSKVNKPTDWVQSLVIVEKPNGNLRLCLDPRDLNKVIRREHYQIPCTDDIISRLEGKKIFSVVDLKDGFWHVPLDEVSSEICTCNTPFGRYKFNKLPFGIVSAPEVFQKENQKLFGDIEGIEIYFDDIIVAGCNEDSHDAIMSKVLERARSLNIKFNSDKLQYGESEVKYVGQIISKSGIKPDPDHIKAIVAMPTPKSKIEVRRLLGMVNFLSKFIPNVFKFTAPLREIIDEKVEFNWRKEQELSFVNIKELLAKTPILKVFSAGDEIIIQCDSSKDGLGSFLIQKGQPVSFVSRSSTNSEKNYYKK
ncbi:retrovirus-related Pol polyprotein from transposon opus [Nephila pilipes]|uniref:Retrovirus-related Pol polyprotein from transposon opus n=1 Tax=Nephila pilipes TaxID=299642 RepID=A0A8X6SYF0_NEPPI|nr:retrovirus-related Pol polyprotein from transposon opus [Nephila pilipes]